MTKQTQSIRLYQLLLPLCLLLPHLVSAQQFQLQFNVKYLCPDGNTYLIHKCEQGTKGEGCYYLEYPDLERLNTRSQVENQFKTCKVTSAPAAAAPASTGLQINTPYQCPGGLVLTLIEC